MSIINFSDEKEFQIWLAREIEQYGFKVYTDKNICELPSFHGDRNKPDLLVFYNECKKENKQITITSPFAIECKFNEGKKFANISKSVPQIEKYFEKDYYTKENNWKGKINNIFLATPDSIFKEIVYEWNTDKSHNEGIDWAIRRVLWSISNSSGILKKNNLGFYIDLPNSYFYLLKYGILGGKPWKFQKY